MLRCVTFIIVIALAQAQTTLPTNPREQLKQYVDQLQKTPGDDGLLAKIIQLAQTIEPRPDPPDAALEASGRGKFLSDHATSAADWAAAAAAFGRASLLAPWVPDYYYNQGLLLEKAERYQDAIKAFRWYLATAPPASERAAVVVRIGGLQVGAERAAQQAETERRAAAERRQEDERNRNKQMAVQAFKDMVGGRTYDYYLCAAPGSIKYASSPGMPAGTILTTRACNQKDYDGSNWHRDPYVTAAGFQFPGEGIILFCALTVDSRNCPSDLSLVMRGTISSPSNERCSDTPDNLRRLDACIVWQDAKGKAFWMLHDSSFSTFTVSININGRGAPARDSTVFDANERYQYTMYRARN